jgi:predicted nucleotidyltransferase
MPVRSLSSSVFKWPKPSAVVHALKTWAADQAHQRTDIIGIAYFGSYARHRSGVGSDLDILVIVEQSKRPFWERALEFDTLSLPVPAEVVVYTVDEWQAATVERSGFLHTIRGDAVWVYKHPRFTETI